MKSRPIRLACGLVLAFSSACGGSSVSRKPDAGGHPDAGNTSSATAAKDEIDAVPFASTKVLPDAALAQLSLQPDGVLRFADVPAMLADVRVGQVVVAGRTAETPQGLLRVVTQVDATSTGLTLHTLQAPVQLAFRKLHLKTSRGVDDLAAAMASQPTVKSAAPLGVQAEALRGQLVDEVPLHYMLFDADGDPTTMQDQVALDGSFGGGFTFDLSVDVDWGDVLDLPDVVQSCVESLAKVVTGKLPDCSLTALLPEAKVEFAVDPVLQAHLAVAGAAALSYEKHVELASFDLPPIPLGPVVVVPRVDLTAKVEGSAGASFALRANGRAELQTAVSVSSKHPDAPQITPLHLLDTNFNADTTAITLTAQAKAGLGARLNVALYGVVGPYAEARAYAAVKADFASDPCWNLGLGVEGDLGVRVTSPELPLLGSVTLVDWQAASLGVYEKPVSSGACDQSVRGTTLPPGSGPDAMTLAQPAFSPWASIVESIADDGAVGSPTSDGLEWTDVEPAIDGRYVLSASRAEALVKVDDQGARVFAKRYRRESTAPPLRVLRSVPSAGAGIALITQTRDGEAAGLLEVDSSGVPRARVAVEVDDSGCPFDPRALVRDAGTGYYAVSGCIAKDYGVITHFDADFKLLSMQRFADPTGRSITPLLGALVDSDLVVLGLTASPDEGERMFALRVNDAGETRYAVRYESCDAPTTWSPDAAIAASGGELVVVGSASGHRSSFLARLKNDGSVASAGFSGFGPSLSQMFIANSVAVMPTTGYVIAGSTLDLLASAGDSAGIPSVAVTGLDAGGRPLWAKRYTLSSGRGASFGSLRLTDDGGVVVAATTAGASSGQGGLLAMKAFARDGAIDGVSSVAANTLPVKDLSCSLNATSWAIDSSSLAARVRSVDTMVEDVP